MKYLVVSRCWFMLVESSDLLLKSVLVCMVAASSKMRVNSLFPKGHDKLVHEHLFEVSYTIHLE